MAREIVGGLSQEEGITANGSIQEALDYEQMSSAEVMAELGRINLDYARRGLLWGEPNPIQERYIELNKRVQRENLWGEPHNTAFSPIASTLSAIKK